MEQQKQFEGPLNFIHFNDVYQIEESVEEPVGGAARFITAIQQARNEETITFFSGDCFSPSALSALYQGLQMIYPLVESQINVGCLGNHDFDYSLDDVMDLMNRTEFPWVLSNVMDKQTGKNLANAHNTIILNKQGFKIGVFGLAQRDWLDLFTQIDTSILQYEDFAQCAQRLSKNLREVEKCDLVIALTHMRDNHDIELAEKVPEIDFILGGHDHNLFVRKHNQSIVLKSGTNFKNFTQMFISKLTHQEIESNSQEQTKQETKIEGFNQVYLLKNKFKVQFQVFEITKSYEPDLDTVSHVDFYIEKSKAEMKKTIGVTDVYLELRFSQIRSVETNFSNFYADLARIQLKADIALINTGCLRIDTLVPRGELNLDFVCQNLPFNLELVTKKVSGKNLLHVLENGVSKFPAYEGRFLAVSGMSFAFDHQQPPFSRVIKDSVIIHGQPLQLDKYYVTAMRYFISIGKDGYQIFNECENVVEKENGIPERTLILNFFQNACRMIGRSFTSLSKITEQNLDAKLSANEQWAQLKIKKFIDLQLIKEIRNLDGIPMIVIAPTTQKRVTMI